MTNPTISVPPKTRNILKALAAIRGIPMWRIVEDLTDRAAIKNKDAIDKYYADEAKRNAESLSEIQSLSK